jgi:hypothetical protein
VALDRLICLEKSENLLKEILLKTYSISPMRQQFVVTHTILQIEIPALLDSWGINTPSVKMLCPQKNSLYFRKNLTRLRVGLLRICHVFFSLSCKVEYRCVTTNCFFL